MNCNLACYREQSMEQCNVSMRMTLAKRRLSLESGWLGVLLFHTFFSLSVLLLFSLLLDSPFDASLHSSYTYYPTPCLFTHSANPTSTHHFPCTGVFFFFGLTLVLHPALYLSILAFISFSVLSL
jgi:hypothetical protein